MVPNDADNLELKYTGSRRREARGDSDKGSSHTCPWPSTPPGGAPSYQVMVPDDAGTPESMCSRIQNNSARGGGGGGVTTSGLLTRVHGPPDPQRVQAASR